MTGSSSPLTSRLKKLTGFRPAEPGESRFWCSCDTERENPFWNAGDLVRHVSESRALDPRHGSAG